MTGDKADTIGFEELERRALKFETERKLEDARYAFDAALKLDPSSQSVAEGRARVALALREDDVLEHCSRALKFHDDHPERQFLMISTVAAQFGGDAIPLFEDYLRRHPQSAEAHELFAELRAERGDEDRFMDGFVHALADFPENKALLTSYWNVLTRAGRMHEALASMDARRSLFQGDRDFALLEVQTANHAGLTDRAQKILAGLDDRPDAQLARGQNRLQAGEPQNAADLLETVVQAEPGNLTAWSLLEVAWRITDNPRHQWLVEQPGLYGSSELDLSASQLAEIAAALRTMHRAKAQPIGQSVRGGTQTPGQLLLRDEPEIKLISNALADAIRQFVGNLPEADPDHPLLRHRNMGMAFGPSWSVRFTGSGFHAAHFHPGGIISSACYIIVPDTLSDEVEKPGWLEIGRPPPELGLDLPPLASFEPKPGRLVLFPSFLFHGTRPFTGGERLTVAFDIVPVAVS